MAYKCPYCGREFNYFFKLRTHVKRVHNGSTCPVCGVKVNSLVKHARMRAYYDLDHAVLYGLIGLRMYKNEFSYNCRELAEKRCKVM